MEGVHTFWAMQACLLVIKPVISTCCLKLCRVFFLLAWRMLVKVKMFVVGELFFSFLFSLYSPKKYNLVIFS